MIFLFFGTSLALLEAELQHFKDWEEIGDICEFSRPAAFFAFSRHLEWGGPPRNAPIMSGIKF